MERFYSRFFCLSILSSFFSSIGFFVGVVQKGRMSFVAYARGLPWQNGENAFNKWLNGHGVEVKDGALGIYFVYNFKRVWRGDAYIELLDQENLDKCVSLNGQQMDHRYVEFKYSSLDEMEKGLKFYRRTKEDYVVKLRGLPYSATEGDVRGFFSECNIAENGITLTLDASGRASGEGYVVFQDRESLVRAVAKDKEKMESRYVEIYLASNSMIRDKQEEENDFGPDSKGGGAMRNRRDASDRVDVYAQYVRRQWEGTQRFDQRERPQDSVFIRGLPYSCTREDIIQFFHPLNVKEVTKNMSTKNHRFDGTAWISFYDPREVEQGLKLDRKMMGHRYVEVFLHDPTQRNRGRGDRDAPLPPMPYGYPPPPYAGYGAGDAAYLPPPRPYTPPGIARQDPYNGAESAYAAYTRVGYPPYPDPYGRPPPADGRGPPPSSGAQTRFPPPAYNGDDRDRRGYSPPRYGAPPPRHGAPPPAYAAPPPSSAAPAAAPAAAQWSGYANGSAAKYPEY